ncbi:hypothetical protein PPOP_1967 [Paenibacillus popilliae ATCC 14706]|uniref:Uncharacterized protein n=1 Tax=Paenibacillus popilliae ATCC 14706 TaxID=1212764 RepID=M9LI15_PAEPP|nr:hypothetical protein PPOP_1967 [Paenibacillus popilliae ATCC 14706]
MIVACAMMFSVFALSAAGAEAAKGQTSSYDTRTHILEKTWNDNKISWMKAYVIAELSNHDDKIVGTPRTDSALLGLEH